MKRFEMLEEKIRRTAALIRSLREERASLQKRLAEREGEIEDLRARLEEAGAARGNEDALRELSELRSERQEILARVDRMLHLLDEAATLEGSGDLLSAVDEID
jgi:chromosome segregation ATPase